MISLEIAKKVISEFGTNNVFVIAEKAGVKIVYESWFPTTIGEFHEKTQTIFVNERALENSPNAEMLKKTIIAHELGHCFFKEILPQRHRDAENINEENFCDEFARELLK